MNYNKLLDRYKFLIIKYISQRLKCILGRIKNNHAYATIEISVLIWIILLIVFTMFYGMSWEFQKAVALTDMDKMVLDKVHKTGDTEELSAVITPETIGVISEDKHDLKAIRESKNIRVSINNMMIIHRQLKNIKGGKEVEK